MTVVAVTGAAVLAFGGAQARAAAGSVYYVNATATAGGDGSMAHPFSTLAATEAVAGAGDTIEVLPSVAALDGGIVLKRGQQLIGAGPAVIGLAGATAAPRITNTSAASGSGDAVELADATTVSNIAVVGAYRGGIYGANVTDVDLAGNDVTGTNTSCQAGFVVQPFTVPTAVPGASAPFSNGLSNGWAGIMVDESDTDTTITATGNNVHDGTCSDGIDVRLSGTARATADISGNTVVRLQQSPTLESVLAIGLQAIGTSQLSAEVNADTEMTIGSASAGDLGDADSEGLFLNAAGSATLTENASHNTFAHGIGHLSANCAEEIISSGTATETLNLADSTCTDVVGDIIEAVNLATGSTMVQHLDHVTATHSTLPGAAVTGQAIPVDEGDCLNELATGSGSSTSVTVANSTLSDCVASGLAVVANVVDGTGLPVKKLAFDVEDSAITGNAVSNLRVLNVSSITDLVGKIQDSDLSRTPGVPVEIEQRAPEGTTTDPQLDLGGGSLGSTGGNCIYGGAHLDASTVGYDVSLQHDWWGAASGPDPSRTPAVNGRLTDTPFLTTASCGAAAAGTAVAPAPAKTTTSSTTAGTAARATPASRQSSKVTRRPAAGGASRAVAATGTLAYTGADAGLPMAGLMVLAAAVLLGRRHRRG